MWLIRSLSQPPPSVTSAAAAKVSASILRGRYRDSRASSPPTAANSPSAAHTSAPAIYPKLAFDPLKDFIPITMLVSMPMILAVHPSVPAHNMHELIALAKQKPG